VHAFNACVARLVQAFPERPGDCSSSVASCVHVVLAFSKSVALSGCDLSACLLSHIWSATT
jgi:hypothetical protein